MWGYYSGGGWAINLLFGGLFSCLWLRTTGEYSTVESRAERLTVAAVPPKRPPVESEEERAERARLPGHLRPGFPAFRRLVRKHIAYFPADGVPLADFIVDAGLRLPRWRRRSGRRTLGSAPSRGEAHVSPPEGGT